MIHLHVCRGTWTFFTHCCVVRLDGYEKSLQKVLWSRQFELVSNLHDSHKNGLNSPKLTSSHMPVIFLFLQSILFLIQVSSCIITSRKTFYFHFKLFVLLEGLSFALTKQESYFFSSSEWLSSLVVNSVRVSSAIPRSPSHTVTLHFDSLSRSKEVLS